MYKYNLVGDGLYIVAKAHCDLQLKHFVVAGEGG